MSEAPALIESEPYDITGPEIAEELPRPWCYRHMHAPDYESGVVQMIDDLRRLAQIDGCIAAAWVLSQLEECVRRKRRE